MLKVFALFGFRDWVSCSFVGTWKLVIVNHLCIVGIESSGLARGCNQSWYQRKWGFWCTTITLDW